jgi:hypothetical protein
MEDLTADVALIGVLTVDVALIGVLTAGIGRDRRHAFPGISLSRPLLPVSFVLRLEGAGEEVDEPERRAVAEAEMSSPPRPRPMDSTA